jgi:sialate O-acetylesterase
MTGITAHKVILALLLCATSAGAAEFKVANVFQDHMVLQRNKPIKIWGWSTTGDKVTVSFAGQRKMAKADKDGKWMVTLDSMPASNAGRTMTVASSAGRQAVIRPRSRQ